MNLTARISLRSTSEGGRKGPISSGYRPNFWFGDYSEGHRAMGGGSVHLNERELLAPGESAICLIVPMNADWRWKDLVPGAEVEIYEGEVLVGTLTVLRVDQSEQEADA